MNGYSQTPKKAETVTLNGSNIYYEVYGHGQPLFLLHGYTHSSKEWLPYVSDYVNDFEVYLLDLKGHGKSSKFSEKLSIMKVAEDMDHLVRHLKLDSIYAIGYSFGGDILFQLALLHPGLIKSMVVVGSCGIADIRLFPQWVEYLSYKNISNLPWMREEQTSEEQIKSILEQVPNYIVSVSAEEFKSIPAKTLLIIGDHEDSILWEDLLTAKSNLPNSYLWVIPNASHRAHKENKTDFIKVSKEFLGGQWFK
ncbi:MAG: alpha/beta fold hydrolase [Chitinophagales bacterium]